MNIQRKIANALILLALAIGTMTSPAYADTNKCGVGQVNKNGHCVNIPITSNRAARIASCILRGGGHGTTKQQMAQLSKCYHIK